MPELEMRPAEILQMYWMENLMIEEDAEFCDPVYIEVTTC